MADPIDLGIPGIGPAALLDRGGSAYVYLAEQEDFGRQVAVKVLFDVLTDDATYRRFDRECRAIGAVSHHPNIAVVHGRGLTTDERPYLVMEYRSGGSLADRLAARGRLTEAEVITIGIKIGGALEVAHDAGVLHRDVKPANILVSAYGEPALADFGIARVDGSHKTTEGVFSASVVHASRQVLNSEDPTPQSDVYALGSTLFELATGAPAYANPDDVSVWAVVNRVLHQDLPDPVDHGVSEGLAQVLRRAMDHDPTRRYQRATELVEALTGLASPVPSSTRSNEPTIEALTPITANIEATGARAAGRAASDVDGSAPDPPAVDTDGATTRAVSEAGESAQIDRSAGNSRRGAMLAAALVAVCTAGIGLFSFLGPGQNVDTPNRVSTTDLLAPLTGAPVDRSSTGTGTDRPAGTNPVDTANDTVNETANETANETGDGLGNDTPGTRNEPMSDTIGSNDPAEATETGSRGPFTPELRFPRAEIGPLQADERYVLAVAGVPGDAEYRIIVDGRPVTGRESSPPIFFPRAGRHQLQLEVATDDRVELTEAAEIYVSDRPPTIGYRVHLAAIRSRPENWPETLRQFDQLATDGHDGLEISLSDRSEGTAFPYWNLYVRFGQDREAAYAYCQSWELPNTQCYAAELG